jgi:hypothetical protein
MYITRFNNFKSIVCVAIVVPYIYMLILLNHSLATDLVMMQLEK